MVELGRSLSFNPLPHQPSQGFLDFHQLYQHYFQFIVSAKLDVSPSLYDVAVPKSPLQMDISLAYVGKSSLNILTELYCKHSTSPLGQCLVQSVCVDKESRRPAGFPEWWMSRYKHLVNGQPLKSTPLEPPLKLGQVVSQSIAVDPTGADPYFHANWTSYLMMCHRARLTALLAEGQVTLDALHMPVKSATLSYWKEGNLQDKLSVCMWPDETTQKVVHFQFQNESSQDLVCQATVKFFDKYELPSTSNVKAKV